jgi:hypothetical protein
LAAVAEEVVEVDQMAAGQKQEGQTMVDQTAVARSAVAQTEFPEWTPCD